MARHVVATFRVEMDVPDGWEKDIPEVVAGLCAEMREEFSLSTAPDEPSFVSMEFVLDGKVELQLDRSE